MQGYGWNGTEKMKGEQKQQPPAIESKEGNKTNDKSYKLSNIINLIRPVSQYGQVQYTIPP